jgi:hypothetical protein
LYFIPIENLSWSRNSGPGVNYSYKKSGLVQKSWTRCISLFHETKIWAGPEILDQANFVHTENLGWSRNSGPVVFHSYKKSELVQKFWTWCNLFIQKIGDGPEILDQLKFVQNSNSKSLSWSRNSGPGVTYSYKKSELVQKFWTCWISFKQKIWASPENRCSRNSGPAIGVYDVVKNAKAHPSNTANTDV